MSDQSANRATFRKGGYRQQVYLTIVEGDAVAGGVVSSSTDETITVASWNTGNPADILEGMEVVVTDGGGAFKGRLRVAPGGVSGTTLQVNEHSDGRLSVAASDVISVRREWRVRDRLVAANATFDKDSRVSYSNQNAVVSPIANAGGARVGFTTTFDHDASDSFAVDPDNTSGVSVLWDVDDGTITTGTSTDEQISVQYPVGQRWISVTVTDDDNSATAVKYVPVVVHDTDNNAPYKLRSFDLQADRQNGWTATFEVQDKLSLDEAPDGARVIIWTREWFDGTETVYRDTGNVLFDGWLVRDDAETEYGSYRATFEAVGTVGRLRQLPGFSQALIDASSPDEWLEYKDLSVTQAIIYLLRWHTTAFEVVDFTWSGTDADYPAFYIQQQTPLEQVRELADAMGWYLTSLRDSALRLAPAPELFTGTRSGLVTTLTLQARDVARWTVERAHTYENNRVEGRGFIASSSPSPVFSRAPGNAPSEAPGSTIVDRLIVTSQGNLNVRTGYRYAQLNRLTNGLPAARFTVDVLTPAYDVFDLDWEWVRLDISGSHNGRTIDYDVRTTIDNISRAFDGNSNTLSLTLQEETDGAPGTTYVPPQESENGLPDFTLPSIEFPPLADFEPLSDPQNANLAKGTGTIALIGDDRYVYTTSDFNTPSAAGGPTWTRTAIIDTADGSILNAPVRDFVPDPYSPAYINGSGAVNGWLTTSSGGSGSVYRVTDIFGSPQATLRIGGLGGNSNGNMTTVETNIAAQNFVVALNYRQGGEWEIAYTQDDVNWNSQSPTTGNLFAGEWFQAGGPVHVSAETAGKAWVGIHTNSNNVARIYSTTDYGATWALDGTFTRQLREWSGKTLHIPYQYEDTYAFYADYPSVGSSGVYRNNTYLGLLDGATEYSIGSNRAIHTAAQNPEHGLVVFGDSVRFNPNTSILAYTNTMLTGSPPTWTQLYTDSGALRSCAVSGNGDVYYAWGVNTILTGAWGSTPDEKIGNIVTDFGGSRRFVNICGG